MCTIEGAVSASPMFLVSHDFNLVGVLPLILLGNVGQFHWQR